jgi:hypothetical protein
MGKWGYFNKLLSGTASKGADDFPAIQRLLASEKAKEARFGTKNPLIRRHGRMWEQNRVDQDPYFSDRASIEFKTIPPSGIEDTYPKVVEYITDSDNGLTRYGNANTDNLDATLWDDVSAQPIFWADDAADAAKAAPKRSAIEDAMIRERERERMFNTNNPLRPERIWNADATELRQLRDSPSGSPRFESVDKSLIPIGEYRPGQDTVDAFKRMEKQIEEQLAGKRFFFPAQAKVKQSNPSYWVGSYTENGPIMSMMRGRSQDEKFSWPWIDGPNVFFADGSTI